MSNQHPLDQLVAPILAELDRMPPKIITGIARGLMKTGDPGLERLGAAFDAFWDGRDRATRFACVFSRRFLRYAAYDDVHRLLEKLGPAQGPPWAAVKAALRSVRDEPGLAVNGL